MGEDESMGRKRTSSLASIGKNRDISRYPHKRKPKKTGEEVKFNRPEGGTLPFPGILGHCTLCNNDPAVYHSTEQRTSVCEGCYARLVREANRDGGVREKVRERRGPDAVRHLPEN
jgi:hypothetical protein